MSENKMDDALAAYGDAARQLPGNPEVKYWAAVTLMTAGHEKEAMGYFKEVFAKNPKWKEVTRRLPAAGLLPDDAMVDKILGAKK